MVTGGYGGMGYNPWATFDWNVSGTGSLVTPFFSSLQQHIARMVSGIAMMGIYWSNKYWAGYMPINSNEAFRNDGTLYNVSKIIGESGLIDIEKYKRYGPPYYGGNLVTGQGSWFAWYTMSLTYIGIRHGKFIGIGIKGMVKSLVRKSSNLQDHNDPHSRMMRSYPEVPDWWFMAILAIFFALGVTAIQVYPTHTPWWMLLVVIGMSSVFLLPSAFLLARANVSMGINILFQLLAGVWFAGNPEAQIIVTAFGQNFDAQADNYITQQKLAHYAKLPPRVIFRGQMLSVLINCFSFIGMLNWMVSNFDNGTLCERNNAERFVCPGAVLVFASAIEYGAFGVRNFFKLYPILPWTFLIGALIGISFGVGQMWGYKVRDWCSRHMREDRFEIFNKWVLWPASLLSYVDPAVFWGGSHQWTGGNNLSYGTNGLYLSIAFMYFIKRRYSAWWEKYNYLLEAGFDVGVAVSGLVQTLSFAFPHKKPHIVWWGNTVATKGVDFKAYNQKASLLPVPKKGYFGLEPDQYPMSW